MRESLLLTEYELKRLDDEIAALQAKREKIAKQRLDGGKKIVESLSKTTFEITDGGIMVQPAGFLKSIIPSYIGPQEEYAFELEDGWKLDVNDYGCFVGRMQGSASKKETLEYLRKIGVPKTAITIRHSEYWQTQQDAENRKTKTAQKMIEEVW